jgi:hypothetical protein
LGHGVSADGHHPDGFAEPVTDTVADDDHQLSERDAVDHGVRCLVRQFCHVARRRLDLGEGQERPVGQRVADREQGHRPFQAELHQFQLDDLFRRVKVAGHETQTDYIWSPFPGNRSFLFHDPDGALIQAVEISDDPPA